MKTADIPMNNPLLAKYLAKMDGKKRFFLCEGYQRKKNCWLVDDKEHAPFGYIYCIVMPRAANRLYC